MGRTSSKVKDRYNKKAYDMIAIRFPKGWKDHVKAAASKAGESYAGYIRKAVETRMANENIPVRTIGVPSHETSE